MLFKPLRFICRVNAVSPKFAKIGRLLAAFCDLLSSFLPASRPTRLHEDHLPSQRKVVKGKRGKKIAKIYQSRGRGRGDATQSATVPPSSSERVVSAV